MEKKDVYLYEISQKKLKNSFIEKSKKNLEKRKKVINKKNKPGAALILFNYLINNALRLFF